MSGIKFAIDRGGTFTDVYAELPDGNGFMIEKLLSHDPANYDDAPREGIRRILQRAGDISLPRESVSAQGIDWIRMGTTVATNALLERKGARTALVITKGFKDLLRIGDQSRPHIFDLRIDKPQMLYSQVVEVDARVRPGLDDEDSEQRVVEGVSGEKFVVERPLDADALRVELHRLRDAGISSVAVVLMHAYGFVNHELEIGEIAQRLGFEHVSLSHQVRPTVKILGRGDTTVVNAYLTPHIEQYLSSFRSGFVDGLENTRLQFMQSDGGLTGASAFCGSNAILSGPAGGVVGYAETTFSQVGNKPVIGFDMGGTSTDVSRFGGTYELVQETRTAGCRIAAPQLQIQTVAAGGGSRLFFRNGLMEVGPESAGAHPGPICYRKNGWLAITDANLLLGRIQPDYFPHIFGKNEDQPLDVSATRAAFAELTERINSHFVRGGAAPMTPMQVAMGFLEIANEVMVRPIREVSVMRGFNIKEHVLACFGGSGGQHACAIAKKLGVAKVYVHKHAGILSAVGMGLANVTAERQQAMAAVLDDAFLPDAEFMRLENDVRSALHAQGFDDNHIVLTRYLNLRYEGTDTAFMIAMPNDEQTLAEVFSSSYLREFGFVYSDRPIVVDDVRVRGVAASDHLKMRPCTVEEQLIVDSYVDSYIDVFFDKQYLRTPVFRYEKLAAGIPVSGPALIMQSTSTIVVEPGCTARMNGQGDLEIDVARAVAHLESGTSSTDPVLLSVFSHLFMSVAEQAGRTLQKTAVSTNIKERLDFSCALFDSDGGLVANAPHLPVHLGAMSEAVKHQIRLHQGTLVSGDVLVTNIPSLGGSHLPDITVITPIFFESRVQFYLAARGHHADIGGMTPGSMPPFSTKLSQEGIAITSVKVLRAGVLQEEMLRDLFKESRRASDNISDLMAQVAANKSGVSMLNDVIGYYGLETTVFYMARIQENAALAVRRALMHFAQAQGLTADGSVTSVDYLDDGTAIVLDLSIDPKTGDARFNFSRTDDAIRGNLNAPAAITYSAVLYVLRCLLDTDIPLNSGCLAPIEIVLRKGSLLNPPDDYAVVGGNVLTSQRITDVLLKAFGAVADSQGCMNNLTFGNATFGYYETIGGGAGAGPDWHGQSGVHTHMTNTRITDPEILERRYPVKLSQFALRHGSGGDGKFKGGDGLIRELQFLAPLTVSILSERRERPPQGMNGGGNGACGKNTLMRKDGTAQTLPGKTVLHLNSGDRFIVESPGGGGYGAGS